MTAPADHWLEVNVSLGQRRSSRDLSLAGGIARPNAVESNPSSEVVVHPLNDPQFAAIRVGAVDNPRRLLGCRPRWWWNPSSR